MPKYKYAYKIPNKDPNKYFFIESNYEETEIVNLGFCKTIGCEHNTPIEASDRYRDWLLEFELILDNGEVQQTKCQCPRCPNYTTTQTALGNTLFFNLCDEHRNKETITKICGYGFPLSVTIND